MFSAQTDCPKEEWGEPEMQWGEVPSLLLKLKNEGCFSTNLAFSGNSGVLTQT